jgi:hypothetical protein
VPTPVFTETFGPFDAVGTWRFVLHYPGDAYNTAGSSACEQYPMEVTKVGAALSPVTSPPNPTVGGAVSAGVSVLGSSPTGVLTLQLFSPADQSCSSAVATRDVAVVGPGPYMVQFTASSAGTWNVTAAYSGDATNVGASLSCGQYPIRVGKAVPELRLVADPATARHNDTLTARLELRNAYGPTGRVVFRLFGPSDASCAGSPVYVEEAPVRDGVAATTAGYSVPKQQPGTWNWTAGYDGDPNNAAMETPCGTASVAIVDSSTAPQHTTVTFASNTSTRAYSGFPGPAGGGATLLGNAQLVCLSAIGCPPGATNYGSPFGGAWTSDLVSIPGASWIWRPGINGDTPGADHDQVVFSFTVVLAGKPSDAWIAIAVDDYAEIRVNGDVVGSIGDSGPAYGSLTRFDLGPFVKSGKNTIAILARNGPWCGTCPFSQNPAGVVYGGAITLE